jgi:Response receiver domain
MNSFEQFVEKSARSYLQSVVYIDDKIYHKDLNTDMVSVAGVPPASSPFSIIENMNNEEPPAMADELVKRNSEDLELNDTHPKQLMESFAEMGIVCALYEPPMSTPVNTNTNSTIFNLCQRADIVVLDWDLFRDNGAAVSDLIANLVKESADVQPHHFRLFSIYTNQTDLLQTAKVLKQKLEDAECADVSLDEDKLQLASGATRVSILGKPGVPGRTEDIENEFVVPQHELAERLLKEVCYLALHCRVSPQSVKIPKDC